MSAVHIMLETVALWLLSQGLLLVSSASANSSISENYDLPDNIVPLSYKIEFMPDMDSDNFTFSGKSEINISVKKPTTVITLHAKNLNIDDVIELNCFQQGNYSNRRIFTVLNKSIDNETDFLKIYLQDELPTNANCNLTLSYSSIKIDDDALDGLYRSSYSEDGTTNRIIVTYFEPINARKAFPCWDEPAIKAHFSISIKHKTKYVAFSNMHIVRSEKHRDDPTQVTTHFAQTPKMSTYLVAIVVGDFISAVDSENSRFRFWTRKNISYDGEYVQRVGSRALDYLEDYLNFTYEAQGLKKIDMIAIPRFEVSGMENWGLITCKESKFALTENSRLILEKEWMVTVIIHELAHQWFGNLVTLSRWIHVWLNEGFATYLANIIMNKIEPASSIAERFVIEIMQPKVMDHWNDVRVRAIEHQWNVRKEQPDFIPHLMYQRSPAILRMISYTLGEEKFQTALRRYIKAHAFASVTSEDLFRELSGGDQSLIGFMKNWVTQPGYPLITVTRDYENETATITQSRFLLGSHDIFVERYWIPLNFATEDTLDFNNTKISHWFHPSHNSVEISELKKNKFVIFNKQQFGLYRVNYDKENWQLIARYLRTKNHNDIHVINRAQLIDDAYTLAKDNKLQYDIVLSLMAYLEKETDYLVWTVAFPVIQSIRTLLRFTEFDEPFEHYTRKLMEKLFTYIQSVKYDENDHVIRLNRANALKEACYLKTELCRTETSKIVARWIKNPEEVTFSREELDWITNQGLQNDNQEAWDKLWAKVPLDLLTYALPYTHNVTLFEKYLLKMISDDGIEFEDIYYTLIDSLNMPHLTNTSLSFAIQHYKEIIEHAGYSGNQTTYMRVLVMHLKTEIHRNKLKELLENSNDFSGIVINETLQLVDGNIKKEKELFSQRFGEFKLFFDDLTLEKDRTTERNSAVQTKMLKICQVWSRLIGLFPMHIFFRKFIGIVVS